ncbi:MAG: transcription termination/antitermination factor NusG [Lentisphaeria bacterium]|nr:transcription termination/antitermination factor NusG [Lentisphaeria bacterium]
MDRNVGQWFVLHALSSRENKVRENILAALQTEEKSLPVYEVLIPTERVVEHKKGGGQRKLDRKFYPGYVLVRMDLYKEDGSLNEDVWYFIRGTQGVIGFLGGTPERPTPLSQTEVDDILRQTDVSDSNAEAKPKIEYEVGERVRIIDGAFENFEGVITKIDGEHGKLELDVTIFGRSTPVEAESWQVEREQ